MTMLRIGDAELTREGRMCLLVTLSRFAPNFALIEAIEMLAWDITATRNSTGAGGRSAASSVDGPTRVPRLTPRCLRT